MMCSIKDCKSPAECTLIAEGEIEDEVGMCRPCRDKFLDGWDRMKTEEQELRDAGVPQKLLEHIMVARVERGCYG